MDRFIASMAYALMALVVLLFTAGVVVIVTDDPRPRREGPHACACIPWEKE